MALSSRSLTSANEEAEEASDLFYQFYRSLVTQLRLMIPESPAASQVLLLLIERSNKVNVCVASQEQLSQALSMHRNTVSKAIRYLATHNFIQVTKQGTTNRYCINAQLVWQGNSQTRRTAPFSTEFIPLGREAFVRSMKKLATHTKNQPHSAHPGFEENNPEPPTMRPVRIAQKPVKSAGTKYNKDQRKQAKAWDAL